MHNVKILWRIRKQVMLEQVMFVQTLNRNQRRMPMLLMVTIVHLVAFWLVIRHTGLYALRSVNAPPISVLLMTSSATSVSVPLAPLTARLLKSEPRQIAEIDSPASRLEQRRSRRDVRAATQESALTDDKPAMQQIPAGQEPAQSQPAGKPALVMPNLRDGYFKQKSAGEQASEQLNPNGKRDRWAEGIQRAAVPDCVDEQVGGGLLGIPILIYKATSGKCK